MTFVDLVGELADNRIGISLLGSSFLQELSEYASTVANEITCALTVADGCAVNDLQVVLEIGHRCFCEIFDFI